MTVADVLRVFVVTGLGVLAVVIFLVAGTITGLMIVDDDACRFCDSYPVGYWTMGVLAALFAYSMVHAAIEHVPSKVKLWYPKSRESFALAGIVLVFFLLIFVR